MDTVNNEFPRKAAGMETTIPFILISVLLRIIMQLLQKSDINRIGSITLNFNLLFSILWSPAINLTFSLD